MEGINANEAVHHHQPHHTHEVHIVVDGEPYETKHHEMTPNAIIREFGEKDPATNYLVQIEHHGQKSYEGKGTEPIKLHNGEKFQIISTGPTTVSDQNVQFGVVAFTDGLKAMGFDPLPLPGKQDHVVIDYKVECGKFAGQQVKLGFIVPPEFPLSPPSGPHVSPHVREIKTDGTHPTGAIHQTQAAAFQEALGTPWQYWSRPFVEWGQSRKTVPTYMSHIWRLWNSQ